MRLRDDYTVDCAKGVERWNKIIEKTGVKFKLELPHVAFHRQIGEFKAIAGLADRRICWTTRPGASARTSGCRRRTTAISSPTLMTPVSEPGKFAGWIAPPKVGIDNKPGDFEYVKIAA